MESLDLLGARMERVARNSLSLCGIEDIDSEAATAMICLRRLVEKERVSRHATPPKLLVSTGRDLKNVGYRGSMGPSPEIADLGASQDPLMDRTDAIVAQSSLLRLSMRVSEALRGQRCLMEKCQSLEAELTDYREKVSELQRQLQDSRSAAEGCQTAIGCLRRFHQLHRQEQQEAATKFGCHASVSHDSITTFLQKRRRLVSASRRAKAQNIDIDSEFAAEAAKLGDEAASLLSEIFSPSENIVEAEVPPLDAKAIKTPAIAPVAISKVYVSVTRGKHRRVRRRNNDRSIIAMLLTVLRYAPGENIELRLDLRSAVGRDDALTRDAANHEVSFLWAQLANSSNPCVLLTTHRANGGTPRGVLWHLSTGGGKHRWKCPIRDGIVRAYASSTIPSCSTTALVREYVDPHEPYFCTEDDVGQHVSLSLDGILLIPEAYSMASTSPIGGAPYPRNWRLEASKNGVSWMTLRQHRDDTSLKHNHNMHIWDVESHGEWFSHFRIVASGPNAVGTMALCTCAIEFFGRLFEVRPSSGPRTLLLRQVPRRPNHATFDPMVEPARINRKRK